jgi:uncharacterized protein (DUF1778 family)
MLSLAARLGGVVITFVLTTDRDRAKSLAMARSGKTTQLQLRVTPEEKAAIQRSAKRAGMDMSSYVLARVLPSQRLQVQEILADLTRDEARRNALAELGKLLRPLGPEELRDAVSDPPPSSLSAELQNYVAAIVEHACGKQGIRPPAWTASIPPLAKPLFASSLESLRLYLLTHSPPPYRRRNIFIDTSIEGHV